MECKRCGAPLLQGVMLCPECGARQRRRADTVRCAHCHKPVSLGLTVCPHCGRTVRPAGPRWGFWVLGFVIIVLVGLWGLGKLPVESAIQEVQALRERVSGLVQVLGPVSSPTPGQAEPVEAPLLVALVTETPAPTAQPSTSTSTPEAVLTQPSETGAALTPAVTETAAADAATGAPQPTAPTATPTEPPTATPTPTATATVAPSATPTMAPTPTSPPTARPIASGATTYRVQSGDTLSTIAARFGITWEALAAANGLKSSSVLRIGQELIVPAAGAPLPPTATPRPRPTATPAPPTATPLPQLAAPVLVDPGDQNGRSGANALIELTWQPVPGMSLDSQYQIVVRWVEQGTPQEHYWFTAAPGTRVPPWLWGHADQPARQYTWFVQVVQVTTDGQGGERIIPLSPPSQSRVFYWN